MGHMRVHMTMSSCELITNLSQEYWNIGQNVAKYWRNTLVGTLLNEVISIISKPVIACLNSNRCMQEV